MPPISDAVGAAADGADPAVSGFHIVGGAPVFVGCAPVFVGMDVVLSEAFVAGTSLVTLPFR